MAELFKFRCFRCQKLLGAPASRIGTATTCPKCGEGLIIPAPIGPGGDEPGPGGSGDHADTDSHSEPIRLEELGIRLGPEPPPPAAPPPPAPGPVASPDDPGLDPDPASGELSFPLLPEDSPPAPPASGPSRPVARPRDVVLPRTAVVAWSLFALLALAAAFAAGLLLGIYRWR